MTLMVGIFWNGAVHGGGHSLSTIFLLLALLGIVVFIGDLMRKGLQSYARARSKVIALGLFTAVVGLVLAGMAGPVLYQREVWVPAGLLLAFKVARRSRASSPAGGVPRAGWDVLAKEPKTASPRDVALCNQIDANLSRGTGAPVWRASDVAIRRRRCMTQPDEPRGLRDLCR